MSRAPLVSFFAWAVLVLSPALTAGTTPSVTMNGTAFTEPSGLQGQLTYKVINNQRVYIADNKEAGSQLVTSWLLQQVNSDHAASKPTVLGLATGSAPLPLYKNLADAFAAGLLKTNNLITFNLDEYLGLDATHPASYAWFMQENLFRFLDIPSDRIHIPSGNTEDFNLEMAHYQQLLTQFPRDIQILGLGVNGHIAFNEPGTEEATRTHLVELTESTRQANSRFFDHIDQVPSHAITIGIADIMESGINIVLAWGEKKAAIIKQAITGEVTSGVPASFLQTHKNTIWVIDRDAGKELLNRKAD